VPEKGFKWMGFSSPYFYPPIKMIVSSHFDTSRGETKKEIEKFTPI
jgi:hypothetical protein